jgi:penicillin-binding protein 2
MGIKATISVFAAALPLLAQNAPVTSTLRPPGGQIPQAVPAVPAASGATKPVIATPPTDLNIAPSWETQKLARTFVFTIPAPRGQIVDRNGAPFAQTRIAHNLAIQFPTPSQFSDSEASRYVFDQLAIARGILRRDVTLDADKALKHYKNRSAMPLVLTSIVLKPHEADAIRRANPAGLALQPVYQRFYPQGQMAAHIIGYAGRSGGYPTGPIENNELLFPESEGREGLEKTYNAKLTGKPGVMHVSFDAQGKKSAEKITQAPVPGETVVLTLDLTLQDAVERSVLATKRPGAMVITNPNTGEILAMASLPSYDPNIFVPRISEEDYALLKDDKTTPLFPRAFGSAYPPGSTFKIITGLAAMNEGIVDPNDEFEGSPSMEIAGRTFHNHTKKHQGSLAFAPALTVSCNTYFYRVGLKAGGQPILDYAARLGFGSRTGIPLEADENGNLMTNEYMLKVHNRRLMPGDVANLSIGQGDTLVTPLQMALAMGTIGNGGTVYKPRLVLQVQSVDDKISQGFDLRVYDQIEIDKDVMKALRAGMVGVVHGRGGTATNASVPGFKIAAKTGTAQWGSGAKEKVAAWFAGFAPSERPRYAFAAVYEGREARDDVHGGSHAAPVVARVLREVLKPEPKESKAGGLRKRKKFEEEEDEEMHDEDEEDSPRPVRPRVVEDVQ